MGLTVLIVGGGGREHALAWKIAQSPQLGKLFCAPGNAGIADIAECVPVDPADIQSLKNFALKNRVDLTVVGPEMPLSLGIVDTFEQEGLAIFGPSQKASQLEASKIFAKEIMQDYGIPTAAFAKFTNPSEAKAYIHSCNRPLVIKADGLAAGKGVFPARTAAEAAAAIDRIMLKHEFGDAGASVIVEDFLTGEEASFICFTDGTTIVPMPSSQDHKRVFDGDEGPNTGGMGAYSPAPVITPQLEEIVMSTIMSPLIKALRERGICFKGVLYAGLMIENNRPQVLEFNARFGDPETQPLIFKLTTDLIEIIQAIVKGNLPDVSIAWDARPSVCVVMAAGGYPGNYSRGLPISGLAEAASVPEAFVFHAGTALKNGRVVSAGGRVLGVTARGNTVAEAITTAYTAVDKIHWDGVHFRRDIAQRAINRGKVL
jgi:phosphoribosylamine---glycine ligase